VYIYDETSMKNIYEYLDYRAYLNDFYKDRKANDVRFSFQVWADMAGFKAKDFIFRVMRGASRLSVQSANALAKAMGLSSNESAYFREMVNYNQAKTFEEREKHFAALHRMHTRFKSKSDASVIPHDYFELYSEWYHAATRSLINSYGFTDDYAWLAKKVYPAISVPKARKSVALLEKLGLIRKEVDGRYVVTDKDITTGDEVQRGALLCFYLNGMELMKNSLEKLPMDVRNISGLTVGVSQPAYEKIVERIKICRKEIAFLAREDKVPDRVYQVNFHLFPLSDVPDK